MTSDLNCCGSKNQQNKISTLERKSKKKSHASVHTASVVQAASAAHKPATVRAACEQSAQHPRTGRTACTPAVEKQGRRSTRSTCGGEQHAHRPEKSRASAAIHTPRRPSTAPRRTVVPRRTFSFSAPARRHRCPCFSTHAATPQPLHPLSDAPASLRSSLHAAQLGG